MSHGVTSHSYPTPCVSAQLEWLPNVSTQWECLPQSREWVLNPRLTFPGRPLWPCPPQQWSSSGQPRPPAHSCQQPPAVCPRPSTADSADSRTQGSGTLTPAWLWTQSAHDVQGSPHREGSGKCLPLSRIFWHTAGYNSSGTHTATPGIDLLVGKE